MTTINSSNDPNLKKLAEFSHAASKFGFDDDRSKDSLQVTLSPAN